MGGAFGGMMMRVADSMGMGGYSRSTYIHHEPTYAEKVLAETENTLDYIKERRDNLREDYIDAFRVHLKDNSDVLVAAGLVKDGDTLYKILCRAAGVKYRKRGKKNVR